MYRPPSQATESPPDPVPDDPPGQPPVRRGRRGATALEYLVMLSFIIVVAVWTIQNVGFVTRGMFNNAASQTPSGQMPEQQEDVRSNNF